MIRDYVLRATKIMGALAIALALAPLDYALALSALRWWWARWR